MAHVSTYLNFERQTEQAFEYYRTVFGTAFTGDIVRFRDMPPAPGRPALAEADGNLVLHMELPIVGGHVLMGTDAPRSMGFSLVQGNNVHIALEIDTRAETERLFAALSDGGKVAMPLQEMFWGAYFASFSDKFGTHWMVNCKAKQ